MRNQRPDSEGVSDTWKRSATFLVILEDNCTAGEACFLYLHIPERTVAKSEGERHWRVHGGDALQ